MIMTGFHWGAILAGLIIGMILGKKFGGSIPVLSSL